MVQITALHHLTMTRKFEFDRQIGNADEIQYATMNKNGEICVPINTSGNEAI